jgi:formylglycine-generating enzyme required for sulfatase activity
MSKIRVLRGGSFINDSWILRPTGRSRGEPEDRYRIIGFRIVVKRRKQ